MRKRYTNTYNGNLKKSLWDFLLWKFGYYKDEISKEPFPIDFSYPAKKIFTHTSNFAHWVGHCTYFISCNGYHILTDPIWGAYCSPFPIKALRRMQEPSIPLKNLHHVDLVLISHNHYDHLDKRTILELHRLYPTIQWIVPQGLASWFFKLGIDNVQELGWWESTQQDACRITATPTQHFSGRHLWDTNTTHWNGYVMEIHGKRLYFVGDTGYNAHDFTAIGNTFSHMDLSFIPIGTYAPKQFMQPVHINPREAVRIHQDVRSRLSLGMHWKTFRLSEEPLERPAYDLYLSMKEQKLPFDTFLPIAIGDYVDF